MINVSNEFWRLMQERTDFKQNAKITLADGTILDLDENSFTMSNSSVTDSAGVNSIPLGIAISRSIQIELANDDKRFSIYDFFGAKIRLYLTFQLSESIEKIEYGTFTVISPETEGTTVIITANDDMCKANEKYRTNLVFPQKAWVVLQDICASCGISLSTTSFLNSDFEIQEKPSGDYTYRQVIGYIAMIACGNARINRQGSLEIISYDFSFLNEIADGGTFNPWTGGYEAEGGIFNLWTDGDVLDGGFFTDKKDYHILYNFKDSPRVDTDDVVITGVQTIVAPAEGEENSTTILLGQNGYVLKIENPLIVGKERDALQLIGAAMIGGRMRKFEGDHIAYPIAEFMDKAFVVDRDGNTYGTILTDVNFNFFGYTTFKNSAENAVRNASSFSSQGVQAIIEAQKLVKKEKAARQLAEQNMTKALVESSGLYFTKEEQEDKSIICYGHNKPTLEESDVVWKFTAGAIGISNDGGQTYSYGLTVSGEFLANILSVHGINADWIKSGTLILGGKDNGNGVCLVLDENGNEVIRLSKSGIDCSNANITGGRINIKGVSDSFNPIQLFGSLEREMALGPYKIRFQDESTFSEISQGRIETGSRSGNSYQSKAAMSSNGMVLSQYAYDTTVTDAANVVVIQNGLFRRSSSSSKRYKTDITEDITEELNPTHLYNVPVKMFKYKEGYLSEDDSKNGKNVIGFIVEDMEQFYPSAVQYADGKPEMWNSNVLIPAMLKLIQEQNKRIQILEEKF